MPGWNRKSFAKIMVWYIAILCLWFWVREGSVVKWKLVVNGNEHTLFCDNIQVDQFEVSEEKRTTMGFAGLGFSDISRPPLPVKPQEFDDFIVRSIDDNSILLQEDFTSHLDNWSILENSFEINHRGRLFSDSSSLGVTGVKDWENYSIEVTCHNPTEAYLLFRVKNKYNYGEVKIRYWREMVAVYSYYKNGKKIFTRTGWLVEPPDEAVKSILLRFVKIYAHSCIVLFGYLVAFVLISLLLRQFLGGSPRGSAP